MQFFLWKRSVSRRWVIPYLNVLKCQDGNLIPGYADPTSPGIPEAFKVALWGLCAIHHCHRSLQSSGSFSLILTGFTFEKFSQKFSPDTGIGINL